MIERLPEGGSSCRSASIREQFGPGVRRCAIEPFDLVFASGRRLGRPGCFNEEACRHDAWHLCASW